MKFRMICSGAIVQKSLLTTGLPCFHLYVGRLHKSESRLHTIVKITLVYFEFFFISHQLQLLKRTKSAHLIFLVHVHTHLPLFTQTHSPPFT